jgi:hypothetical protein
MARRNGLFLGLLGEGEASHAGSERGDEHGPQEAHGHLSQEILPRARLLPKRPPPALGDPLR